ncbi:MAG: tRNA lysidine(34) synthetase TilS [Ruminococcus sp.]|nr:tRNA lysidine(34) synthetase TilS [Ruminococcus sp.]
MVDKVLHTLCSRCQVQRGDTIIVALSGGADSVSLLYALLLLRQELDLTLMAAHVNHNLRGEESYRDQSFVRALCDKWGIELFVCNADVSAMSKEQHKSVELCGREVRYSFFSELADMHNAKIATAHTLSDAQETMFYNIARGTTLHGLCSIPYKRDYIIRPLLDVTREEVEGFCCDNNLEFVQDSTNFQEDVCKRNKIRLSVLPPLKSLNQGFHRNFHNLRADLLQVDDFLSQTARSAEENSRCQFGYNAEVLSGYHPAVLNYAIAMLIAESGAKAEYDHIMMCTDILHSGGAVALIGGYTAVCTQGIFRIVTPSDTEDFTEVPLRCGLSFFHRDNEYSVEEINKQEIINKKLASCCIGCDKIGDDTVIRTRRRGDTFSLIGRGITKPLRKLQNELKIPAERRKDTLVIATGSTVLWAEDIGVSAQGAIDKNSDTGIYIQIRRGDSNA